MWVCLKMVSTPKPNGFADHYPVFKWLAIIGNINPTFSDKPMCRESMYLGIGLDGAPKIAKLPKKSGLTMVYGRCKYR